MVPGGKELIADGSDFIVVVTEVPDDNGNNCCSKSNVSKQSFGRSTKRNNKNEIARLISSLHC